MISQATVAQQTSRLADGQTIDALIIGGGIVGSGIARDAAMRGMSVGLVEQHDFASGTSSRSSRLLHGGLRYLAQGRVGLVREASLEKKIVQDIAPHLADPLPFIFPTYRGTQWKRWKLAIGVKIYDLLCNGRNFGRSQTLSAGKVSGTLPGINTQGLTGAVRYFDGLTQDARLVIDTLRSAAIHGARVCNYTRYDADRMEHGRTKLRLTKGVHLVIDRSRLPLPDAVVMAQGERILFAIPWGERMILGTTDTDYDGPIANPSCDPEDVRYVLAVANSVFPQAKLSSDDVFASWSGLRPLIAQGDAQGSPSDTSRSHSIRMTEPGWIDVAGGKLTTYRLMAEQTVDKIVEHIGQDFEACQTADQPLLPIDRLAGSGITPPTVAREQVEHYCNNEWAVHLDDVMIRRSSWAHYHQDGLATAEKVAAWMADIAGWDQPRLDSELTRYHQALTFPHKTEPAEAQPQETASV